MALEALKMMETVCSSETLAFTYKSRQRYNPEDQQGMKSNWSILVTGRYAYSQCYWKCIMYTQPVTEFINLTKQSVIRDNGYYKLHNVYIRVK
jgi:hypothetical protein